MIDNCLREKDMLFEALLTESHKQISKWGIQDHTSFEWLTFTAEELGELAEAIAEYEYRGASSSFIFKEAIQVATLALKIAEMSTLLPLLKKEDTNVRSDRRSARC